MSAWWWLAVVALRVRTRPLPHVVATLRGTRRRRVSPRRLAHLQHRALRLGPWRPRCLLRSLVLYRVLRAQGDAAELVLGLPEAPTGKEAHAWVEVGGTDVGPPPGRHGHRELARYR